MLLSRRVLRSSVSFIRGYSSTTTGSTSNNTTSSNNSYQSSSTQSSSESKQQTHFGFKTINAEEKETMVKSVFDAVASKYDVMNDAMSLGIHRLWKDEFMNTLNPVPGSHLLDVAGGTGKEEEKIKEQSDISFRFIDKIKSNPYYLPNPHPGQLSSTASLSSSAIVYDINQAMLDEGQKRAIQNGYTKTSDPSIDFIQGNSEQLPFEDESFNCYTISFGIRNCTNIDVVLKEAYRVLKKGGRFMCLEFSQIPNPALRFAYDQYSFNVIPILGQMIAGDRESYQYLVESIRKFPTQDNFAGMIRQAGFKQVTYKNLSFGICAIHSGWKL
ncbi:ubiE/COQ5 methyltransferase family protein [Cavenderia fasciculata]|uniref:2-methoxy-6-polyprenyl-1,4-benzoquinol methylase, mitochondrial n=1 Tax=Cavenderia fasciculata TaxID=261658 RepID=F4Q1C9_CACFS|nr:ubiE/COQ5 methyltransferase family protein [Cavenderia fasciculata]EGG18630.1 ubiE/COQ5 methyltransferase family protein [Cavenderia fasciculata]|eukprot:XP_004366534.1 ubiE/COQ5 methyltransferase family protein [Cavenderia fasciculata]